MDNGIKSSNAFNIDCENVLERMYQSEDELMLSQCIINEFEKYDQRKRQYDNDYLFALSLSQKENDLSLQYIDVNNHNKQQNFCKNSEYNITNLINKNDNDDCFVVNGKRYKSLVDPELEKVNPNPDIWHLFRLFDKQFFNSLLTKNGVELNWSSKMTLCAGLCRWNPGNKLCSIRLSTPLLQLRSRSDLVETLLHEMIHALLFVTHEDDNHESHGVVFHTHMIRINEKAGTNITVYHNFNDEVRYYQKHVWRCDGVCRNKSPYFGYVRRAMNRKPGLSDFWFRDHMQSCGGNFIKLSGDETITSRVNITKSDTKNKRKLTQEGENQSKIDNFFKPKINKQSSIEETEKFICSTCEHKFKPFSGIGYKLNSSKSSSSSSSSLSLSSISTAMPSTSTLFSSSKSKNSKPSSSSTTKTSFPFRSFFNNSNIDKNNVIIKVIELD